MASAIVDARRRAAYETAIGILYLGNCYQRVANMPPRHLTIHDTKPEIKVPRS